MNTKKPVRYVSWKAESSLDSPNFVHVSCQNLHFSEEEAITASKQQDGNTTEPDKIAWGEAFIEFDDGETLEIYSGQFIVKSGQQPVKK